MVKYVVFILILNLCVHSSSRFLKVIKIYILSHVCKYSLKINVLGIFDQ